MSFDGRDTVLDVRFSFILTLDEAVWRLVQVHCSMAQPNLEFSGIEHNAFAELIEAAKTGYESFGGEGVAVIMFTDVTNSTEIANAVGDRHWAMAIGRQLDLQASAISKHGAHWSRHSATAQCRASARPAARCVRRSRSSPPRLRATRSRR